MDWYYLEYNSTAGYEGDETIYAVDEAHATDILRIRVREQYGDMGHITVHYTSRLEKHNDSHRWMMWAA